MGCFILLFSKMPYHLEMLVFFARDFDFTLCKRDHEINVAAAYQYPATATQWCRSRPSTMNPTRPITNPAWHACMQHEQVRAPRVLSSAKVGVCQVIEGISSK
jgi:hypothetical protein